MSDEIGAERTFERVSETSRRGVYGKDGRVCTSAPEARRRSYRRLNRLASELLKLDDKRPEPWVILSLYHYARHDNEKAMAHGFRR